MVRRCTVGWRFVVGVAGTAAAIAAALISHSAVAREFEPDESDAAVALRAVDRMEATLRLLDLQQVQLDRDREALFRWFAREGDDRPPDDAPSVPDAPQVEVARTAVRALESAIRRSAEAVAQQSADLERMKQRERPPDGVWTRGDSYDRVFPLLKPSVHDLITRESLRPRHEGDVDLSLRSAAVEQAVRTVDWDETEVRDWRLMPKQSTYRPEHHCDRGPRASHVQAFGDAVNYANAQRRDVVVQLERGHVDAAVAALGRLFHVVQDFYSHSNWVDLDDETRSHLTSVLTERAALSAAAMERLRITAFFATAADPAHADGDEFSHALFCKDHPDLPQSRRPSSVAGMNAFELHRVGAVDACRRVLRGLETEFLSATGDRERAHRTWVRFVGR